MFDTLIGTSLGQYQIESRIGQGGMATVYKAYQPSISRYVAVKVLSPDFAKDSNFVQRFHGEAKAVAALEHPHILPVYDFGSQDAVLYMVMRYIEGGTLSDLLFEEHTLSFAQIAQIVDDMGGALDYAHSQGIVHRDVKPSNMMIDQFGEVLLTDFGLAKVIQTSPASRLTEAGTVVGTATYMAPEQAADEELDGRCDVYALGVILFELLTGQPPFQADTMVAVALKHVNETPSNVTDINPDLPESFNPVVNKALEKWPQDRYQTAGELSRAFNMALQGLDRNTSVTHRPAPQRVKTDPIRQPPQTSDQPKAETAVVEQSHEKSGTPWLWAAVGSLITLVVVIGLVVWFFAGSSPSAPDSLLLDKLSSNAAIVESLGEKQNTFPRTNYSRQHFEGGMMVWWNNPQVENEMLVLEENEPGSGQGTNWSRKNDLWAIGEPEYLPSCPEAKPPNGPVKGFGKLWCLDDTVRQPIGMPLAPEEGGNDAIVETYTNGIAASLPIDNQILVLLWEGGWQAFDVEE